MAKIKSITVKEIANERLYNLSVEGDESFVANGIVVHNCKSYIVPVLQLKKGQIVEKLTPRAIEGKTNAEVMKTLQFAESIRSCTCLHHDFENLLSGFKGPV